MKVRRDKDRHYLNRQSVNDIIYVRCYYFKGNLLSVNYILVLRGIYVHADLSVWFKQINSGM